MKSRKEAKRTGRGMLSLLDGMVALPPQLWRKIWNKRREEFFAEEARARQRGWAGRMAGYYQYVGGVIGGIMEGGACHGDEQVRNGTDGVRSAKTSSSHQEMQGIVDNVPGGDFMGDSS